MTPQEALDWIEAEIKTGRLPQSESKNATAMIGCVLQRFEMTFLDEYPEKILGSQSSVSLMHANDDEVSGSKPPGHLLATVHRIRKEIA